MSLAVPDSLVPPGVSLRRRLHRRSSCPSIPRSVSACSSVWAFNASNDELETYMAPLFRGLEGFRGPNDEATEQVSATQPDDFSSTAEKSFHYDDSLSENLSNYHFDITGHDHNISEQPNPSEANLSPEQSPAPSRPDPPVLAKRPIRQQCLPLQAPPVPAPPRPLVPAEPVRHDLPSTGTRPLRIDRSKKRQEPGGGPQRTPRADVPYVRPSTRPIHRAATQVNLREAYRRTSPHSGKAGPIRLIPVARPPPLGPLPEIPSVNKVAPVSTLFTTGLIPLEHAQDKFRHAHCLDRLPQNRSDNANPPTSSTGNRSPRTLGWSFGRTFRKQKA